LKRGGRREKSNYKLSKHLKIRWVKLRKEHRSVSKINLAKDWQVIER
jgi:hypothetical protein